MNKAILIGLLAVTLTGCAAPRENATVTSMERVVRQTGIYLEDRPVSLTSYDKPAGASEPVRKTWVVAAGKSLKMQLTELLKRDGWELAWKGDDVIVGYGATFFYDGDVQSAMEQVAQAEKLSVEIYRGNNVVAVEKSL